MQTTFQSIIVIILFFTLSIQFHAAEALAAQLPKAEIIRLGERMYRDGILPSGATMPAFIRGDVEVDSSAFSCSSCHLRAGLGSFEGGVVTPPTTGNKLYKPYRLPPYPGNVEDRARRYVYARTVVERPAYTRESLSNALRFAIDPSGQTFNDIMPRYPLSDSDMSIMISYLELLSSETSPGASGQEFNFATIITDDVNYEDRQALLLPLHNFIDRKNQQMEMYNDFIKFGYIPTAEMEHAFRRATLDVWELKGQSDTWQKQLESYLAKKPVFAVLGGISNSDWRPVHDFCEAARLPCLFPITNFPVVSETGWYTYYFNKGYVQEGETVARYLNRLDSLSPAKPILQIVQDSPIGKSLAAGFEKIWKELEQPTVKTVLLSASQLADQTILGNLLKTQKPGIVLLWTDADMIPNLPIHFNKTADPGMIFMSSGYLGKKTAAIPENVRDKIFITYPYRLTPYVGPKTGGFDSRIPVLSSAKDFSDPRITSRTTTMLQQAALQGLNLIYDNLYRDHLLDVMSMQMDLTVRDYERLSFGPGQRYVSKGCYIIQLGPGTVPAIIPRSEWVIH